MKKMVKKAQKGTSVKKSAPDSSWIYSQRAVSNIDEYNKKRPKKGSLEYNKLTKAMDENMKSAERVSKKGKPGYDKMGFPVKKQRSGGKVVKKK